MGCSCQDRERLVVAMTGSPVVPIALLISVVQ